MTKREREDFARAVRIIDYLAVEIQLDIDAMDFGKAKTRARIVREATQKIANRYDKDGLLECDCYLEVLRFFKQREKEGAK